ncbi:MAG: class I SAM-dependent methyltransferase [Planctomycetota bacterium]
MRLDNVQRRSSREASDRELFDSISDHYEKKDSIESCRIARRHRVCSSLAPFLTQARPSVLEVGCGAGYSAEYLEGSFASYYGIDYSQQLIHLARQRHGDRKADFAVANAKDFQTENQFDLVFMIGVLHHIDDMSQAMDSIVRAIKPGGWLIANEPQPANPLIQVMRKTRQLIDRSYSSDQIQLSSRKIETIFRNASLADIVVRPQGFFSTPFAEVPMPLQRVSSMFARVACRWDRSIEHRFPRLGLVASWNIAAAGRKPAAASG